MPGGRDSPNHTTAGRARPPQAQCGGDPGQRHAAIGEFGAAGGAAHAPDIAVQLENPAAAGEIVQAVDVLRDQGEGGLAALQFGERAMGGVGRGFGDLPPPPVIPLPHQARVAPESFRRGQVFGLKTLPQAARTAKGGNAAGRGDSGSRHDGNRAGLRQPFPGLLQGVQASV